MKKCTHFSGQCACLMGQCHEIFDVKFFFHESVSPKPLSIILVRIFSKILRDIRSSRCTPGPRCCWHRWQTEQIFNQNSFYYFVLTPLDSRVNKFTLRCKQSDIVLNICQRCRWYRWWTLTPRIFEEILNDPNVIFRCWGGKYHNKFERKIALDRIV